MRPIKTYSKGAPFYNASASRNVAQGVVQSKVSAPLSNLVHAVHDLPRFVNTHSTGNIEGAHQAVATTLPRADARLFIPAPRFRAIAAPRPVNVRNELDALSSVLAIHGKHSRCRAAFWRADGEVFGFRCAHAQLFLLAARPARGLCSTSPSGARKSSPEMRPHELPRHHLPPQSLWECPTITIRSRNPL
jgi:hypothetical protein